MAKKTAASKKKSGRGGAAVADPFADVKTITEAPPTAGETTENADPLENKLIPWYLAGFKLETSPRSYTGDNKETSTRVAQAICKFRGSDFFFVANISRVTGPNGSGFRVSLPSIGRAGNFRTGVIQTDDNASRAALQQWKSDLLHGPFATWFKENRNKLQRALTSPGGSNLVAVPGLEEEVTDAGGADE